ncbi:MAG: 3D domain-containing protein [Tissierellia bacterium]|nr:3D domain-containing protein [Tissierellia bacterium]
MSKNSIQFGNKLRAILILIVLVSLTMGATTLLSREIVLNIDGEEEIFHTTAATVEDFFAEQEIEIKEGSFIEPALDAEIEAAMEIVLKLPKSYTIIENKETKSVSTPHTVVDDILKVAEIKLGEMDYTYPARFEEVEPDTEIKVYRVVEKVVEEIEEIPFETEEVENEEMYQGKTKVVQEGEVGTKKKVIKNVYLNDHLVSTVVLEYLTTKEPVNKIVEIGTKVAQGLEGKSIKKVIEMKATAYDASAESNGKWAGITALGTKLRPGVVAVDPKVIPLGTKLYIESTDGWPDYGFAVAEDTGGAIKGNRIDLFFQSRNTVYKFGRRNVIVHVLND